MNIFNKKTTASQATVEPIKTVKPVRISTKKKNTYIIVFSPFYDSTLFSLCAKTPLEIAKTNGIKAEPRAFAHLTQFPNPFACQMQHFYTIASESDKKIASTIIEYLDKETGTPVAQLYPNGLHLFVGNQKTFTDRLNHASRRDLAYQIKQRQEFMNRLNAMQR